MPGSANSRSVSPSASRSISHGAHPFGFAARVTGGNFRAALAQGLPVGRLIVACSAIAGACAGLAGFFEVAAIQGRANALLAAGYGFTGVLVSFLARHNPLVIPPVAILFGGLVASGGLIQRRMDLPDATVLVLKGFIFAVLLTSETLYGRLPEVPAGTRASHTPPVVHGRSGRDRAPSGAANLTARGNVRKEAPCLDCDPPP
jgi:ABC-type uncharacterized transport system permease subunit